MLTRVLEPEVMDTLEDAHAYDAMDHAAVNTVFVNDWLAPGPLEGEVLDLGTGTALIPIELCRRSSSERIVGIDLSENMLCLGRRNIEQAGLASRIHLERVDGKRLPFNSGRFAGVMSNSIVHHIPEPLSVLAEAWRVLAPGGRLLLRDLLRPNDDAAVKRLVAMYAGEANDYQRKLFDDSLRAALSLEEIRELVSALGLSPDDVRQTSDRHWTWSTCK